MSSTITKSRPFAETHRTKYFIHLSDLRREKVRKMTLLPSSSTSGYSLIFAQTHCCLLIVVSADPHMSHEYVLPPHSMAMEAMEEPLLVTRVGRRGPGWGSPASRLAARQGGVAALGCARLVGPRELLGRMAAGFGRRQRVLRARAGGPRPEEGVAAGRAS